ncbi:MAG: hypothetical protein NUV91_06815 [Candidatus Omnitrophica bacterium]|nr:hypothetical protein [Candidatus Omnitrophota bacterium]
MNRKKITMFIVCLMGLAFLGTGCAHARRATEKIVETPNNVDNWIKEHMW